MSSLAMHPDSLLSAKPELLEIVAQAHDQLHKDDVGQAHALLHRGLGIEESTDPLPSAPLAPTLDFDAAFRTACRKHGVRAMFVAIYPAPEKGPHAVRVLSGGDADLCRMFDPALRRTL